MFSPDIYFIDLNIIYQIFSKNIWYIAKLLIVAYFLFYWLPTKIFPQEYTGKGVQKIVINFLYMVTYVEVVVTFLIAIKVFTLLLFLIILLLTKLAFLKWYYKKSALAYLNNIRTHLMLWSLTVFDRPQSLKNSIISSIKNFIIRIQKSITYYNIFKFILFFSVFFYIISTLISRGLLSYSDPLSDTSQFIEWVDFLQQNILYSDIKTFGADFYGISIMIFFVNLFTNIDPIVLFSLYPILLLLALYLSIYYVIKDYSESKYVALFAVMVHGILLMSPWSNFFLGKVISTSIPDIVNFFGLKFYMPKAFEAVSRGISNAHVPYMRYMAGMAYEHASVFAWLNAYFFIKIFQTKLFRYIILYTLSLMMVFTFHGGAAIILVIVSILLTINAVIFRKINFTLFKQGLLGIFIASVAGNAWLLSMIKYGVPEKIGAAAPIIDKLIGGRNVQNAIALGSSIVSIIDITKVHLTLFAMLIIAFIISFFTKRRFINTSMLLITAGIFLIYFGTNLGMPKLVRHSRLAEYMFFAITILFSFYYMYFIQRPIFFFFKKYTRQTMMTLSYIIFIGSVFIIPRWMDTNRFWVNINEVEYTSIPDIIMKIDKTERPFTWTVISYVQEYAKVKNKGYHVNTQNFLLKYNPKAKYLKIPTPKVYIFVENYPNPYKGMGEWFYRWRKQIENSLKSWVAIYSLTHNNIKVFKKTKTVTVYEIDNNDYIQYLRKKSSSSK